MSVTHGQSEVPQPGASPGRPTCAQLHTPLGMPHRPFPPFRTHSSVVPFCTHRDTVMARAHIYLVTPMVTPTRSTSSSKPAVSLSPRPLPHRRRLIYTHSTRTQPRPHGSGSRTLINGCAARFSLSLLASVAALTFTSLTRVARRRSTRHACCSLECATVILVRIPSPQPPPRSLSLSLSLSSLPPAPAPLRNIPNYRPFSAKPKQRGAVREGEERRLIVSSRLVSSLPHAQRVLWRLGISRWSSLCMAVWPEPRSALRLSASALR